VPAAAVIPAPIAYAKVVAVKKLVVERRAVGGEEVAGVKSLCLPILGSLTLLGRGSAFNRVLAWMPPLGG
jgi:hypothetical protein